MPHRVGESPGAAESSASAAGVTRTGRHANTTLVVLFLALGGLAFAVCALFGLQAALIAVPTLYLVLKVAGGAYLVYLGCEIWQVAANPLVDAGLAPVAPDRWRR